MDLETIKVALQLTNLTLLGLQILVSLFELFFSQCQSISSWLHVLENVEVVSNGLNPPEQARCGFESSVSVLISVVSFTKDVFNLCHHLFCQLAFIIVDQSLG